MTPLQLIMLAGLMGLVFGRSATRTWLGLLLVAGAAVLILGLGSSDWQPRAWAQGVVFAIASAIAIFYPTLLRIDRGFADEYAKVDDEVRRELMEAEHKWQAGLLDDTAYSRAFDRANVRYRALKPPSDEWRELVKERVRIREEWSRIFTSREELSDANRDRLNADERKLRKRIARTRSDPV
jgi:hypothetical protein